jgi:hypothetical protein
MVVSVYTSRNCEARATAWAFFSFIWMKKTHAAFKAFLSPGMISSGHQVRLAKPDASWR